MFFLYIKNAEIALSVQTCLLESRHICYFVYNVITNENVMALKIEAEEAGDCKYTIGLGSRKAGYEHNPKNVGRRGSNSRALTAERKVVQLMERTRMERKILLGGLEKYVTTETMG